MPPVLGKCVICKRSTNTRLVTRTDQEYKAVRQVKCAEEVPMSAYVCDKCVDDIIREAKAKG